MSFNMYSEWKPLKGEPFIDYYSGATGKLAFRYVERPGNSKTILFFYGFSGNIIMMTRLIAKLQNDYNIIVVDYPGHGYSPQSDGFDISAFNRDVHSLLEQKEIHSVYLAGYSLGGIVALDYYQSYSESVKKIMLLHTSAYLKPTPVRTLYFEGIGHALRNNFIGTINDIAIPLLKDKYFSRALLKTSKKVTALNNGESVINYFDVISNSNYNSMVNSISCPALVVCSTKDFLIPVKESLLMAKMIKDCRVIIFRNTGHLSIVSRPGLMAALLTDFIH